jgi:hypothetical protein
MQQLAHRCTVLKQAGFNLGFLAYNVTHPPLDQLKVRQALDIANSTVFQPLRKEVTDFKISPFGLTPFYGVGINK